MKYQGLGGLNNRNLFLRVLGSGKSKVKLPVDSVLWGGPLPSLQMPAFLLRPHMAMEGRGARRAPSYRDTNPVTGAPAS